jgi:hypothetical protein
VDVCVASISTRFAAHRRLLPALNSDFDAQVPVV